MSDKTPPGWTLDTLRAYIEAEITSIRNQIDLRHETETKALEAAFSAHQAAQSAALASQEKAIEKSEAAAERRFHSVNEFRQQLNDQARTFIPRTESIAKHEATGEKLDAQITLVSESLAELRSQMADLAIRFMPRTESDTHHQTTLERLREIEIRMQSYPNREETALALTAADAKFASSVSSITEKSDNMAARVSDLDKRLTSRLDITTGKSTGYQALYGWAVAGVGLMITVVIAANTLIGK